MAGGAAAALIMTPSDHQKLGALTAKTFTQVVTPLSNI
jgi:hypothetical protein